MIFRSHVLLLPLRRGGALLNHMRCCLWLGALALTSFPTLWAQGVTPTNSCTITQITDTPALTAAGGTLFNTDAALSGNATRIAFASNANLTGNNTDENTEISSFDIPTGTFTQITNTTGGGDVAQISLSQSGKRMAFVSNRNLTGDNANGSFEIFLSDAAAGTITQITHTSPPVGEGTGNREPSISGNGQQIGFTSSHDLTGQNPDGNLEIFLFDIPSGAFRQITDTTGAVNGSPKVDANAERIAFVSNADLVRKNADRNSEIFLFDRPTAKFTQVTDSTDCVNNQPSINTGGTRIAFSSTCNLTGNNADGNAELFLFDVTTGALAQITKTIGSSPVGAFNLQPSISGNGQRIAFVSDRDLTGNNADQNPEIFLFDARFGTFTQITNTTGFAGPLNSEPSISSSGRSIAFISGFNLVGKNPDGNAEVFLATCGVKR